MVTCWERADLLALVCGVLLCVCYFPIGILGQVWYLIVSIPDLCILTYYGSDLCLSKKMLCIVVLKQGLIRYKNILLCWSGADTRALDNRKDIQPTFTHRGGGSGYR